MSNNNSITLVVPCYNEEANLQKGVLDKIGNFAEHDRRFKEVLIVDDGSTDTSRDIITNTYLKRYPSFKLIENEHQGKAYAVITGIRNATADVVMFSDIDLATPIEESDKLIAEYHKGNPIVIGSRNPTREGAPLSRKAMAYGFIILRGIILGLSGIKDTQCGFKLFDREAANDTLDNMKVFKTGKKISGSSVSAGFDLEFLYVANKLGYSIKEVPVSWRHVETKNVTPVKDTLETLKDMARIKINHRS